MVSARTKNILQLCLNLKFMCMHAIKQFATGGILEHTPNILTLKLNSGISMQRDGEFWRGLQNMYM